MGTTFSTTQAKNIQKLTPELFKNDLYNYFKKKGFISATESKAEISYNLIFSNKSDWVTLCSSEYEPGAKSINEDAEGIAKALKTHCITASVWDSDFIELELFGSTTKQRDTVVIGCPYANDMPTPKGEKEKWKPLLPEGVTWEQLLEVFKSENTYVEDSLSELAPLIGIDKKNIVLDYNSLTEADNRHIIDLHLKKVQTEGKKAVSLNTAFKQVYGEALEPLGFKLIKSKYPYFVRLIGDEILHVITYTTKPNKHFVVLGGIATVYRQQINFELSPKDNSNWLNEIYRFNQVINENSKYSFHDLIEFSYHNETRYRSDGLLVPGTTIVAAFEHALKITKEIMLPILDEVIDLNLCIEYFCKYGPSINIYYNEEDFGNEYNSYDEGLLYIKTGCRNTYIEKKELAIKRELEHMAHLIKTVRGYTKEHQERYEIHRKKTEEEKPQRMIQYAKIFNDHEWITKAHLELERRKEVNTKILKTYGLFQA